jgi:Cof subfamily protein (haloacid dehalogenase superfamily)
MMELYKEKIKMFCFDIDGTTFDHSSYSVRKLTLYALNELKKKNYKLCLCTGRARAEAVYLPKEFLKLMDGISYSGGAEIIIDNKIIKEEINMDDVKRVTGYMDEKGVAYRYITIDDENYVNQVNKDYLKIFKDLYKVVPSIKNYQNERVIHINYYCDNSDYKSAIEKLSPNSLHVYMSKTSEISPLGADKGGALEKMANYFDLSKENVIAFGDSGNDISMFEKACVSVCMQNGSNSAKERADYIADRIEDDGLYKFLLDSGFIEVSEV